MWRGGHACLTVPTPLPPAPLASLHSEAHQAAAAAPFWDVLQASERAAAYYGQLRRAGTEREQAERWALNQFIMELLSQDELSGIRLSLNAFAQSRSMA